MKNESNEDRKKLVPSIGVGIYHGPTAGEAHVNFSYCKKMRVLTNHYYKEATGKYELLRLGLGLWFVLSEYSGENFRSNSRVGECTERNKYFQLLPAQFRNYSFGAVVLLFPRFSLRYTNLSSRLLISVPMYE